MNGRRLLAITIVMLLMAIQFPVIGDTTLHSTAYAEDVRGGTVECDTTLQMIPLTHTVGGGTIHWHITGEAAQTLRRLILYRLDNATINYGGKMTLPNDTASGRKLGVIDEAEVWAYVAGSDSSFLENYLQGINKMWVNNQTGVFEKLPISDSYKPKTFQGVEITRASLSNHNMFADTDGLIGCSADPPYANVDIDIFMTISMKDTVKVSEIDLSNTDVLGAPFECLTGFNSTGAPVDPIVFRGDGTMNHWTITIGFDSFQDPTIHTGTLQIIRTPAGEIYRYRADVSAGSTMEEKVMHSDFNPLENPQILFIAMILLGYLSVAMPTHYYLGYRKAYPKRYRMEAKKIKWLHWVGRIFLIILIALYFWPMLGNFFVSGPIFLGMGLAFVILSTLLSKNVYAKATDSIPPEYFEKRVRKVESRKKDTGKSAVSAVPAAPSVPVAVKYDSDEERIHCIRCGASITIKEGENLLKVKCPVCGAVQKKVERSYNHLILDGDLNNTYQMLADFLKDGDVALCISTSFPGKLKRTYNLNGKIKCVWLTAAGGKDTLDPRDIKRLGDVIEKFSQQYPASLILLDGMEYLAVEHGFEEAMKFIKRITDVASMMDMTLMVPVNPASLSSEELSRLKAEFDRVEALEDKDERQFF